MQVVLQDRLTITDGRYLLDAQPFTGCCVTLETDGHLQQPLDIWSLI